MANADEGLVPEVTAYFAEDRFAAYIGMEIIEIRPGYARARMNVEERHHNSMGTAHGGAIFSLADFCFGAAANSRGNVAMSINASISYIKAIGSGTLFAEAQEVAVHPRLATYIVTLTNEAGETLAVFQGTAYRKRDRVPGMEG